MSRRYKLLVLATLLLGLGIPWLLGGPELLQRLAGFPAWVLPAAMAVVVIGWNCNAGRLRLMVGTFGLRLNQLQALSTVMATEFAFVATPAGGGAPVTLIFLLQRQGLDRSSAAAVFAFDQLMDLAFFLTAVLAIGLFVALAPADSGFGWQLTLMGGIILATLAALIGLLHHYRHWLILGGRLLNRLNISPARRRALARGVLRFRAAVRLMLRLPPQRLLGVYVLCAAHWLLRYSILFVLIRVMGQSDVAWVYTFVVQMMSFTIGQLTLLPGGSGGVELTFGAMLGHTLEGATLAAVLLAWRFATFHWYLIAGGPVFAAMAGRELWRRLGAAENDG